MIQRDRIRMKRKLITIICSVLAAALLFSACAYRNDRLTGQDTDYAVLGNGGQAVQYGDYVYFINGTVAGFADAEGTENKWGEVEKGGIYRVKLQYGATKTYNGKTDGDFLFVEGVGRRDRYPAAADTELKVYERNANLYATDPAAYPVATVTGASFVEGEDEVTRVDPSTLERVVPKVISQIGDGAKGVSGIYIYDGYIYYATPSNRPNKSGTIEYTLTEFYRTRVDGQGTQRLYVSEEAVTQFSVYRYNGKTYLTAYEGSTLVSVEIDKKVRKTSRLEDDVTDVFFPRKSVYYAGVGEDTMSDFVYYARALTKDDTAVNGNALEMRRPDLAELPDGNLMGANETYAPAGVSGNTLFYYVTPQNGTKALYAQDYSRRFSGKGEYPAAKKVIGDADSVSQLTVFAGSVSQGSIAYNGEPIALGVSGGKLCKFQSEVLPVEITDMSGTILGLYNTVLYYTAGGSLYSLELVWGGGTVTADRITKLTDKAISTENNFGLGVAGDMLFFLVSSSEQKEFAEELRSGTASNYMYCKLRSGADAAAPEYFIGKLGAADLPEEEE